MNNYTIGSINNIKILNYIIYTLFIEIHGISRNESKRIYRKIEK